jgi:coniferyl-aldehyde dehydrogenase
MSNPTSLSDVLSRLRQQFDDCPYPSLAERRRQLQQLKQALLAAQSALYQAAAQDFGKRSASETRMLEVLPSINGINDALRRLPRWIKPARRHVSWLFQPASNRVEYQPLGVVGIIVPWNYPIFLALGPLTAAIAAGNQVMLKLSEFTPAINQVLQDVIHSALGAVVEVVQGDAKVAADFSQLPFDHLLFTGSTQVGYKVMQSAAQHLTPVTLELGGKSPVLQAPDIALSLFADRLIFGKCANAGQTCVAPDYLLVPESQLDQVIPTLQAAFRQQYPAGINSPHYTSVINPRQYQRLQSLLAQARAAGATVVSLDPNNDAQHDDHHRLMAPQLVFNAPLDSRLWQDEIFGPILPVHSYRQLDEALSFIRGRPRPLAFYLFSQDKQTQQRCLREVHAGGVCLNDTLVHVGQDDLPFGGIGPSGLGRYHGHDGFLTFSHAKAVHQKGRFSSGMLAYPHWRGRLLDKVLDRWFGYRID